MAGSAVAARCVSLLAWVRPPAPASLPNVWLTRIRDGWLKLATPPSPTESSMQSTREWPDAIAADMATPAVPSARSNRAAALLQVLATTGYGIWLWLGLSLLLGLSPPGRSGTLIPLGLGAVLAGSGLLLACLRIPGLASWHGWLRRPGHRPTRSALMALATWLPVLAVAGLAHGDNGFWVTRLAGTALMLCSLVSLLLATHDDRAAAGLPHHHRGLHRRALAVAERAGARRVHWRPRRLPVGSAAAGAGARPGPAGKRAVAIAARAW